MGLERRMFLQAAGLAAAGYAASAYPATGHATADRRPPDWDRLRRRLDGELVLPGDADYDSLRRPFNTVYEHRRPAAIARCVNPADVQACIDVAADSRLPVAARSGGHSYAAYSLPERGLVVDLAGMSGVTVRPDGTAVVGAGTKMIDVYEAVGRVGRCLPAGTCGSVGIGGLALGGGISVMTRKFGLTCDHLVGARVVTPDGRLRTATAASEPDLFWALRGGGGGNFGVVTSFAFRTVPAPDLTVFGLQYPLGSAPEVFGAWQDWMIGARDELWSGCTILAGSPPPGRISGCLVGSAAELAPLLRDLHRRMGVRPTSRDVREFDYLNAMRYFAGCLPQCQPVVGTPFVASSRMIKRRVADPARLVALFDGKRNTAVLIDSFGGAVARIAPAATAFPHRSALASAQLFVSIIDIDEAEARRELAAIRDGLVALAGNTGYVNYIDPEMPHWRTAYYGNNVHRLRRVARRYDPDRVLAFPQGLA